MRYTLRYTHDAIQAIYKIPRGVAATVTQAIRNLSVEPGPFGSQPEEDRLHTYQLPVADYLVVYEVNEASKIVKILLIA